MELGISKESDIIYLAELIPPFCLGQTIILFLTKGRG